jgi:hypothetical protein
MQRLEFPTIIGLISIMKESNSSGSVWNYMSLYTIRNYILKLHVI